MAGIAIGLTKNLLTSPLVLVVAGGVGFAYYETGTLNPFIWAEKLAFRTAETIAKEGIELVELAKDEVVHVIDEIADDFVKEEKVIADLPWYYWFVAPFANRA